MDCTSLINKTSSFQIKRYTFFIFVFILLLTEKPDHKFSDIGSGSLLSVHVLICGHYAFQGYM